MIRGLLSQWPRTSFALLLARHSNTSLSVRPREDPDTSPYESSLGTFVERILSGKAPPTDYALDLVKETAIRTDMPELTDMLAEVPRHHVPGDMYLIVGGTGSGLGWHAHCAALNVLLVGEKQWGVRSATVNPTAGQQPIWQCTQEAGDVIYVPASLEHSTHGRGNLVVALAVESRPIYHSCIYH